MQRWPEFAPAPQPGPPQGPVPWPEPGPRLRRVGRAAPQLPLGAASGGSTRRSRRAACRSAPPSRRRLAPAVRVRSAQQVPSARRASPVRTASAASATRQQMGDGRMAGPTGQPVPAPGQLVPGERPWRLPSCLRRRRPKCAWPVRSPLPASGSPHLHPSSCHGPSRPRGRAWVPQAPWRPRGRAWVPQAPWRPRGEVRAARAPSLRRPSAAPANCQQRPGGRTAGLPGRLAPAPLPVAARRLLGLPE
mmetsp:Transcript_91338/g.282498  ORF Transcript_91338/g.282498 Transcript_91338/m.282498 type:complete len:248 (+) Transcript_91338:929-1672(+)